MIRQTDAQTGSRPTDWKHEPTSIAGKSVLVTGGTTGIGRATVRLLTSQGARVMTFGRHDEPLEDMLRDTEGLGEVHAVQADQSQESELRRVFDEARRQHGELDVLIANAALPAGSVTDSDVGDIRQVIETNLLGYLVASRLAIESMRERGRGQVVLVGSLSSKVREAGADVYVATKAGIAGFAESLRKQVNEQGIRVSLVEPGEVGSDFAGKEPRQQREEISEQRSLTAEDIAEAVLYCVTQPARCDITELHIRPHRQTI
ncbi:MAG: SDR family oxidoreductase [Phycisphaeraceae bacterium]